ncbi:MAG TPA: ABC transporter substrate-binding protein [Solirubrobacterales bacterium]|nr:ABC transporter substrate-binding protein [Solirubrobacterales bacterium]
MKSRLTALIAVIAFAAVTVAAGCGSSNNDNSSSTGGGTLTAASFSVQADPAIAGQVPASVKSSGSLSVAADATYAPDEFIASDGKTVIGMDADLAKAIAQTMGLTANVQNIPFDSIIPGLAAGKYDLGMSSFTDTKDREKTVDFVTYATAGTSFFVLANGGPAIASLNDLCGHKVGAEKGTTQADDATAQDKTCTAAGKPGVSLSVFPDENGVNLALSSGRIDVAMADTPPADYAVKQSDGKFKLTGNSYGNAPYGIAMSKDSGLQQPVLAAVKALMADGTYKKILDYWGVSDDAISNPTINGATS